jgi:hypothetical protein
MRTQEEIVKKTAEADSMFGFEREVLLLYVGFEQAKPFLNPDLVTKPGAEAEWNACMPPLSDDLIKADMAKYMAEYGWNKAMDHRGLSAGRTIEKMLAWLWLLGDEETIEAVNKAGYENYGCPKLAIICQKYNLPIPSDPAVENMINGQPCSAGCRSCGQ